MGRGKVKAKGISTELYGEDILTAVLLSLT